MWPSFTSDGGFTVVHNPGPAKPSVPDDPAADAERCLMLTRLLNDAGAGNAQASAELLPLVYEQLRALAARKMSHRNPGDTLQATALVHEAYIRLMHDYAAPGGDPAGARWDGRWHFFSAAAEAMRRILIESTRRKLRLKRGGGRERVSLDDLAALTLDEPPDDLLALDEALDELAQRQPEVAELVKLRYFAGLTTEQAAEALGISVRTAGRDWAYARAWLYSRITAATDRPRS